MKTELSCFISPHGFGHATRTIAVLEALQSTRENLHVQLLTTVPESLFRTTALNYSYHPITVDVGFVQKDSFTFDLPGTAEALDRLFPAMTANREVVQSICSSSDLVVSDISAFGIKVGRECGIPSILVENFTWDWIYDQVGTTPELKKFIPLLQTLYGQADFHIQTEPICLRKAGTMTCSPVSRSLRSPPEEVRQQLNPGGRKIVLITTGGIATELPFIHRLARYDDYFFVLAGQKQQVQLSSNVLALSHESAYHHPDLINSSDLVICKSGYSTIAECCQTKTSIVCIHRPEFPESSILEGFVRERLNGAIYEPQQFLEGAWLQELPSLMDCRSAPLQVNGARQIADFINTLLH